MQGGVKTFVSAINNVFLLEVRCNMHGSKGIDSCPAVVIISPGPPAVLAAPDRTMTDGHLVFYRPPDNTLCARICTSPDSHDAGPGFYIRFDLTGAALS